MVQIHMNDASADDDMNKIPTHHYVDDIFSETAQNSRFTMDIYSQVNFGDDHKDVLWTRKGSD